MIPAGTALGAVQVALAGAPVIGQVDSLGRLIQLGKLDGWWDPPGTSGTKTQKVNSHGTFIGPAYYTDRVITVEARVDGFSPADSLATAQQIIRAVSLDSLAQFSVTDEAETLYASVRQEGDPLLARSGNRVIVSLSLSAPDPLRYTAPVTVSTGLPATSGGLVLPIVLPIVINGVATSGVLSITNTGDIDSYPVFTVVGPCAPFTISDSGGRQLAFAGTVDTGHSLIIDTGARTALLDGVASRVVTGTWPRLVPGVNQFIFNASSYNAASQLSITYRSARR